MNTKICTYCNVEKPNTEEFFQRCQKDRPGLRGVCRSCFPKKYRKGRFSNNPEEHQAYRDKENLRLRNWKEQKKLNDPEAYEKWRNKENARVKKVKEKNPELYRQTSRIWRKNNPDKVRAARKRHAQKDRELLKEYKRLISCD